MRTGLFDIEALVREPTPVGRGNARWRFDRADRRRAREATDGEAAGRRRSLDDDAAAAKRRARR
jgi:hypothetical protein